MSEDKKNQSKEQIIEILPQELVEAGAHLGHKTSRWHPKMEQYLYGAKSDVHIFDLEKTADKFREAVAFLQSVMARGGLILFVGTKPAAKKIIKEAAGEVKMPYVIERWLGGTLTNFKTISKRLQYYRDLEEQKNSGGWEKYVKKERVQLQKKLNKLHKQLEGIRNLTRLPEAVVISDMKVDNIAWREAKICRVPVVAICDSNVNPVGIDYVIPANDDSSLAVKLIFNRLVQNLKNIEPIKLPATPVKEEKIKK